MFFKADHIVITNSPLVFKTHNVFQAGTSQRDMGVFFFSGGPGKLAVHLGQVGFLKKQVGLRYGRNPCKPQFLHQPILVKATVQHPVHGKAEAP